MEARRLLVFVACLAVVLPVASITGSCGDDKSAESQDTNRVFSDAQAGVAFQYPPWFEVQTQEGVPSMNGMYSVLLAAGSDGADGHSDFVSVSVGGWGAGKPRLRAMAPLERLKYIGKLVRKDPDSVCLGDDKLVRLETCEIVHGFGRDGLLTCWVSRSKSDRDAKWYTVKYDFYTKNDLLGEVYAIGPRSRKQLTTDTASLVIATLNVDTL